MLLRLICFSPSVSSSQILLEIANGLQTNNDLFERLVNGHRSDPTSSLAS